MKYIGYFNCPIGLIGIMEEKGAITEIFFTEKAISGEEWKESDTPLLQNAKKQLAEYFSNTRKTFDLPLNPKGTEFMQKVWKSLQEIPYGETRSYQDIAKTLNNPKACRAVGMANNRNPIAIVIPCHRVIGANGHLVGYAGGLGLKEFLLTLEGSIK